jgi:GNAT superfamily N-acetyltransferase
MEIVKAERDHINWIIRHRIEMFRDMGWNKEELDQTEPLVRAYLESLWDDQIICFLAIADDQVVGGCAVSMNHILPSYLSPTGRHGYIHNLFVEEEYRRKGIGARLLEHTIDDCKERGISKVWLHSTDKGLQIYLKAGFERSENFYGLGLV